MLGPALAAALALAPAARAAPSVSVTFPMAGAPVAGVVQLQALATSSAGVAGVQFRVDGADVGPRLSSPPYSAAWNSALGPPGTRVVSAVAWDVAGASAASVGVPVVVEPPPPTAPAATAPPAGGAGGIGPGPAPPAGAPPAPAPAAGIGPGPAPPGGAAGAPAPGAAATVPASPFAPSVVLMTPAPGAALSGVTTLSANASGGAGIASVQFFLDGVELAPAIASAPYSTAWNTAMAPDGPHTLTAVARDAAGNSATSAATAIMIENSPPAITAVVLETATATGAAITWTTDKRSDSQADYGPTPAFGRSTALDPVMRTKHGVSLRGLSPGTQYYVRVRSKTPSGAAAMSEGYVFTTSSGAAASAPGGQAPASTGPAPDEQVKAPQKFLTPASADGRNDRAVFGPQAAEVWIYDVNGRQVFHASSAGPSSPVIWDARDGSGRVLPSGVYIARLLSRDGRRLAQSFAIAK